MINFEIPIVSKSGIARGTLIAILDLPHVPRVDDTVIIDTDYGVSATVRSVTFAPTCDPSVYVLCKTLSPEEDAEAEEIIKDAVRYGWHKQHSKKDKK